MINFASAPACQMANAAYTVQALLILCVWLDVMTYQITKLLLETTTGILSLVR